MAVAAQTQVLYDGVRNLVMQLSGVSDGTNENNVIKIDMKTLVPKAKRVSILCVTYDVPVGLVRLQWAADQPIQLLDCCGWNTIDYESIGGVTSSGGDNATGNLLLSTLGFEAGSSYNIKLEMVKKF